MNKNTTLLPPNESAFLKAKELAYRSAINDNSSALVLDPMSCDEKLLPHLAQVVQVLYWSELLTVEEKRLLIANSKMLHKHLGTPFAIKKVFELLNREAELVEWFESEELEPYHFKVKLFDRDFKGYSKEHIEIFELMLETYKNVRSVLDEIAFYEEQELKIFSSVFLATGEAITLLPETKDFNLDANLPNKAFFALEIMETITYKGVA